MSVSKSLGIYQHVEDAAVSSEGEVYTRIPRMNAWKKRGIVNTLAMVASSLVPFSLSPSLHLSSTELRKPHKVIYHRLCGFKYWENSG
jgi:hypothetical protein